MSEQFEAVSSDIMAELEDLLAEGESMIRESVDIEEATRPVTARAPRTAAEYFDERLRDGTPMALAVSMTRRWVARGGDAWSGTTRTLGRSRRTKRTDKVISDNARRKSRWEGHYRPPPMARMANMDRKV